MKYFDIEGFKKANNLVNKDIADFLGVSPSYVSMVATGQTSLSDDKLSKLSKHPFWDVTLVPKPDVYTSPFLNFLVQNSISRKQIAEFMGVSVPFVSQIVKGQRTIPADKLQKILSHPIWDTSYLLNVARRDAPDYEHPFNLAPTPQPTLPIPMAEPKVEDVEEAEVIEAEAVELPIVPTSVVRQPDIRLSKWLDKYSDTVERLRLSEIINGATMVREVKEKDMCPDLKVGQYIYLEKISKETPLKQGHIYFVDHSKLGGFFRKLYDRGETIECRTARPTLYESNIIRKEDIYDIFQIVGVFSTDVIEDSEAALKDQQIATLTAQLERLTAQAEAHTHNTADAIESTKRAIAQIDKVTSQQGELIEMLKNK